jgi:hypothetical protein
MENFSRTIDLQLVRSNSKVSEETNSNINPVVLKLVFHGKISSEEIPRDILSTLLTEGFAIEKGEELLPTNKGREYADTLRAMANL